MNPNMRPVLKREWGAVLFVGTVILGALAILVIFIVNSGHQAKVAPLPPCPTYVAPTPTSSAPATATAKPDGTPTASPFDVQLANCPVPTAPPTPTPKTTPTPIAPPTLRPVTSAAPTATPAPSVGPTAPPTPVGVPVPTPVN